MYRPRNDPYTFGTIQLVCVAPKPQPSQDQTDGLIPMLQIVSLLLAIAASALAISR